MQTHQVDMLNAHSPRLPVMEKADLLVALRRANEECRRGTSPGKTLFIIKQILSALEAKLRHDHGNRN